MNSTVRAIGIAWYLEDDYAEIRSIMDDGDRLPATWHQWRLDAEQAEKRLRRQGIITVKAYIDPRQFPGWCRARGLDVNAEARQQFAAWCARQEAGRDH